MNAFVHEPRRKLTDQQLAAMFLRHNGKCAKCTRKIRSGELWHADHIIALENGGTNDPSNFQPLCAWCHAIKTKEDHGKAAKSRAVATAHVVPTSQRQKKGRPLPGTKRSGWKHKISGDWERR